MIIKVKLINKQTYYLNLLPFDEEDLYKIFDNLSSIYSYQVLLNQKISIDSDKFISIDELFSIKI